MADISKCKGLNCPKKNECWRHNAPNSYRQYWTEHIYDNGCKHFWKDTHKPTKQIIRNNIQKSE